ncbi:hypothetical protein PIROE2DRAFT_20283 [Piromyces sp. E2]|nr:hypothetical protein PIROE2DRAFT_20283 [Piromyces sp. E2]|eukprot:OUM65636.1 hypothetical protein PIROE2DRAFT_20283 [Piromyces sp. E2]
MATTTGLIMVAVTLYVLSNSNMLVVKDLGVASIIFISLGCIIKNFSNFYIITNSNMNCFLHVFISSLGFILIYVSFTTKLIISSSFTIKFNTGKIDYILMNNIFTTQLCQSMFFSEKTKSTSQLEGSNQNKNSKLITSSRKMGDSNDHMVGKTLNLSYSSFGSQSLSHIPNSGVYGSQTMPTTLNSTDNNISGTLPTEQSDESKVKQLQSKKPKRNKKKRRFEKMMKLCYYSVITLYIVFIIYIIPPALYGVKIRNKPMKEEIMVNKYYHHICPANHIIFGMTLSQFIFLIYDILKFQWISNGRYIFIDSKIIGIICILWIFADPGINITLYTLFKDNLIAAQKIQFYSNLISCLLVFFGYFSYIIYMIFTKKGNERYHYFLNIPKAKCIIHNSYTCSCPSKKVELYNEDELENIKKK